MALVQHLPANYATALELIDEAHARDPRSAEGVPQELRYAQKMTRWLALRCPDASPALQLACRAQHFRRFVSRTKPSLVSDGPLTRPALSQMGDST